MSPKLMFTITALFIAAMAVLIISLALTGAAE